MISLSTRIETCMAELVGKMKGLAMSEANYNNLALFSSWVAKLSAVGNLEIMGGLNSTGKLQAELLLVECYKACGTSCDMRGMLFVNVYIRDKVQMADGSYKEQLFPLQSILTNREAAPTALSECQNRLSLESVPRMGMGDEVDPGFNASYEFKVENTPAVDIAGVKELKSN